MKAADRWLLQALLATCILTARCRRVATEFRVVHADGSVTLHTPDDVPDLGDVIGFTQPVVCDWHFAYCVCDGIVCSMKTEPVAGASWIILTNRLQEAWDELPTLLRVPQPVPLDGGLGGDNWDRVVESQIVAQ
jgi:hypothetical protein